VNTDPKVTAAIAAIGETAWTGIRYPRAIWDDQLRCWVSGAQIAEIEYTAFTSKKSQAITARLIVRRVRDLSKPAAAGQDELFPTSLNSPFRHVTKRQTSRGQAPPAPMPPD
jgi:hypothetical protein